MNRLNRLLNLYDHKYLVQAESSFQSISETELLFSAGVRKPLLCFIVSSVMTVNIHFPLKICN